jgi:hypothetical protein
MPGLTGMLAMRTWRRRSSRRSSLDGRRVKRFPRLGRKQEDVTEAKWDDGGVFGETKPQICRSTIFSLSSAIASEGFKPFGQALAQFMMVWQR